MGTQVILSRGINLSAGVWTAARLGAMGRGDALGLEALGFLQL